MIEQFVIGVDFGSDSARATVVGTASGETVGTGVSYYPRWKKGLYQHPELNIFRQHPLDYMEALSNCVTDALSGLTEAQKASIVAIGVDTTGSTPAPVDHNGTPLALIKEYSENEDAMFWLWKDHSADKEAEELCREFREGSGIDYCKYQGTYSAEWYWAKILHAVRSNEKIREAAYTWVEQCDWIIGLLCGETRPEELYHSACAAGHKALWHSEWNGLPAEETLRRVDPYLAQVRARYGHMPRPASAKVGTLCKEWAEPWGLSANVIIAGSSYDAHAGAVGAGIRKKTIVCTIGTSAVDMVVADAGALEGKDLRRFGGQAENSILPGMIGLETGQAAFGDIFAWFKRLLLWPIGESAKLVDAEIAEKIRPQLEEHLLLRLEQEAERLSDQPFLISLDWFNGRRYPDTDDDQRAMIAGLSLGSDAPQVYRSLVFGAICGLKRIIDGFENHGVEIEEVIAVGGISKKSPYIMQMMSDTLGKRIAILDSDQTCAHGAAMYAATAAGIYDSLEEALHHMAARTVRTFSPAPDRTAFYRIQYEKYLNLAKLADRWKQNER